jgi:hypothetical protein
VFQKKRKDRRNGEAEGVKKDQAMKPAKTYLLVETTHGED